MHLLNHIHIIFCTFLKYLCTAIMFKSLDGQDPQDPLTTFGWNQLYFLFCLKHFNSWAGPVLALFCRTKYFGNI